MSYDQHDTWPLPEPTGLVASRHGAPWTSEEERQLRTMVMARTSVDQIAITLRRSITGIEAKMEKMHLRYSSFPVAIPDKHYETRNVLTERIAVNTQHLIALLQKGYTTIEVSFVRGRPDETQKYTYKIPEEVRKRTKVDDFVVVETQHGLQVAKVKEIHEEPLIDVKAPFALKWIVCRVDRETYDDQVKRETEAVKTIERAERKAAQEKALNELLGGAMDREALQALINVPEVNQTKDA